VIEIGGSAAGVKVGDRVAVNPSRWCGHCKPCRENRPNLCENIFFMGSASKTPHMQGGFSSVFDSIPAQCVKIPDHVTYQAAALAEPLAVCLHAVARAGDVTGSARCCLRRPNWAPHHAGGAARRDSGDHRRRYRGGAAGFRDPARRQSCRRHLRR